MEQSTRELSLRRVPPNLLVGQGATDFAFDQGMPVLPHDALVSPAARERWLRWKHDLKNADRKARHNESVPSRNAHEIRHADPPPNYEEHVRDQMRRSHTKAMKASVWNEGQPASPSPLSNMRPRSQISMASQASSMDSRNPNTPTTPMTDISEMSVDKPDSLAMENSSHTSPSLRDSTTVPQGFQPVIVAQDATRDLDHNMSSLYANQSSERASHIDDRDGMIMDQPETRRHFSDAWHDGHSMTDESESESSSSTLKLPSLTPSPTSTKPEKLPPPRSSPSAFESSTKRPRLRSASPSSKEEKEDCITDTVGAIAIDSEGNIACGASSGGIGMKFRGRIGPAALVGVGAAVMPVDIEDRNHTCTAAVTSGTGEHMGTTLAANVCAERLYYGLKKRRGGGFEQADDHVVVRSMIEQDFMGEYINLKEGAS